jgi:peptide/nickel transport system permease protein
MQQAQLMVGFLLRRLVFMLATLLLLSVLVFAITEVIPGDFATVLLGKQARDAALLEAWRSRLNLDQPPHLRYLDWLGSLLRGDWGESWYYHTEVFPLMMQRLRNSAALVGLAFVLSVPTGILLGIVAGVFSNRWPDYLVTITTLLVVSLPEFVIGTFLIILLSSWIGWLPSTSLIEPDANLLESIRFLVLPALTLVLATLAHLARMTRGSMSAVMQSEYIRTAFFKGLPFRTIVLRHALPNALLPTISIVALNIGWMMGGAVVVERVFAYPGLGSLLLSAVSNQDIPLLQSVALLVALIYALANLSADILYHVLDPRIRY